MAFVFKKTTCPISPKEEWESLPVSEGLLNYDDGIDYLERKRQLAEKIEIINTRMKLGTWKGFKSWAHWDFVKSPVFCHQCKYPVHCIPEFNPGRKKMLVIKCSICELVMWSNPAQSKN